jgi:hypothetical protein
MKHLPKAAMLPVLVIFGSASLAGAQAHSWQGLKTQSYNGVPYISGGVGLDERSELRAMAAKDNLELSFALKNKNYLGGANILIKDDKDHVILDAASDGPLFYAKLPQGAYTIMATANGKTIVRPVRIPDKGKTMAYFVWPTANSQLASTENQLKQR